MQLEANLTVSDLAHLVDQLTPVRIRLGNDGDLRIHDVTETTLVAGRGLRIVCKAKLHWPILGLSVPVLFHSLRALLLPSIQRRPNGPALVFRVEIEHADLAGIPSVIDDQITHRVNAELAKDEVELAWHFMDTLAHSFVLPTALEGLRALDVGVVEGKVFVSAESFGLRMDFRADVTRDTAPVSESASAPA